MSALPSPAALSMLVKGAALWEDLQLVASRDVNASDLVRMMARVNYRMADHDAEALAVFFNNDSEDTSVREFITSGRALENLMTRITGAAGVEHKDDQPVRCTSCARMFTVPYVYITLPDVHIPCPFCNTITPV